LHVSELKLIFFLLAKNPGMLFVAENTIFIWRAAISNNRIHRWRL